MSRYDESMCCGRNDAITMFEMIADTIAGRTQTRHNRYGCGGVGTRFLKLFVWLRPSVVRAFTSHIRKVRRTYTVKLTYVHYLVQFTYLNAVQIII